MSTIRVPINRGEDKPLLVSIMKNERNQKDSDEETYIDKYGKPMGTFKKWKYKSNGNNKGILMGAANIFNKWPDHLAMCWIIAVVFCLIIIVCILMMESSWTQTNHHIYSLMNLQEKCMSRHSNNMKNTLQEKTNIYLHVILNEDETFHPEKYETTFISVGLHHPNHMINVYVLHNDTFALGYKRNTRFKDWELKNRIMDHHKFFDTSSAEDVILPYEHQEKFDLHPYDNVKLVRSTFSNYFQHSPLKNRWRIIPTEMMPFVFRVLTLWENGGITMPWRLFLEKTDIYCINKNPNGRLKNLMEDLKKAYAADEVKDSKSKIKRKLIEELGGYVDLVGGSSIERKIKNQPKPTSKADIIKYKMPRPRKKPRKKVQTKSYSSSSTRDSSSSTKNSSGSTKESSSSTEDSSEKSSTERTDSESEYEESSEESKSSEKVDKNSKIEIIPHNMSEDKEKKYDEDIKIIASATVTDKNLEKKVIIDEKAGNYKTSDKTINQENFRNAENKEKETVVNQMDKERKEDIKNIRKDDNIEDKGLNVKNKENDETKTRINKNEENKENKKEEFDKKEYKKENRTDKKEERNVIKEEKTDRREEKKDKIHTKIDNKNIVNDEKNERDQRNEKKMDIPERDKRRYDKHEKTSERNVKDKAHDKKNDRHGRKYDKQDFKDAKNIKKDENINRVDEINERNKKVDRKHEREHRDDKRYKMVEKIVIDKQGRKVKVLVKQRKENDSMDKNKKNDHKEENVNEEIHKNTHKMKFKKDGNKHEERAKHEKDQEMEVYSKTHESRDKKGKRVKREVPTNVKDHEDFKPPSNLFSSDYQFYPDYVSDDSSSSSSYSSSSYYSSYSGLNANHKIKTNMGKRKKVDFKLSIPSSGFSSDVNLEPSSSKLPSSYMDDTYYDLNILFGQPVSESLSGSKNYFKEDKIYVKHKVFDFVNIFAIPGKSNLVLDKYGYYFSSKRPCHAFLGNVVSSLQSTYELKGIEILLEDNFKSFCRGQKYDNCRGITLL